MKPKDAMHCEACRRQILVTEDPDNPPLEVVVHLGECQGCRDWQRQVLQTEKNVARLPVPPSSPDALLDKILGVGDRESEVRIQTSEFESVRPLTPDPSPLST